MAEQAMSHRVRADCSRQSAGKTCLTTRPLLVAVNIPVGKWFRALNSDRVASARATHAPGVATPRANCASSLCRAPPVWNKAIEGDRGAARIRQRHRSPSSSTVGVVGRAHG